MLSSMPHVSATGSNLGKKLLSLSDKLVNGSNGFRDRLLTAHLSKRTEIQSTMRVLKGWIALLESCSTAPLAKALLYKWMTPDTTQSDMRSFIDEYLASVKGDS